jgi:hypothetical protein
VTQRKEAERKVITDERPGIRPTARPVKVENLESWLREHRPVRIIRIGSVIVNAPRQDASPRREQTGEDVIDP